MIERKLRRRIKFLMILYMVALAISGITAFPIETEFLVIDRMLDSFGPAFPLYEWLRYVSAGIKDMNAHYPFIGYGTDWLAFAHLVIAVVFWGPMVDPVRNKWVLQFGVIACLGVFPLALIAGEVREIPWLWRMGDCAFGAFGLIPLLLSLRMVKQLEQLNPYNPTT